MPNYIPLPEKFTHHRELVGLVANAGVPAPARWTELNTALDAYLNLDNTAADRLAHAVVNPTETTDLTVLRALALSELNAGPQQLAQLNAVVVAQIEAGMHDAWAEVARDNYLKVAEQYNGAAAEFTTAAQAADVEADAAAMVAAEEPARQAWLNAVIAASRLTELVKPLVAAAQLAGTRLDAADEAVAQAWWDAPIHKAALFGLLVDAGEVHRRRAWEAFEREGGRTGRWGALVAAGARIRAVALEDFAPYRQPRPLIHRQQQILGAPMGTVENITIDPEDDDKPNPLPPIDPKRRPSRLTAV
jgi:hypothetical protein